MILDTNAVSALLAGDQALGRLLEPAPRHHLPVVVIGEYRFGLIRSRYRHQLTGLFDELIRESEVLQVDESTADVYSEVREKLRQKGRPIPENDVWIAALAVQHREAVVSLDRHFDDVPGIRRLGW